MAIRTILSGFWVCVTVGMLVFPRESAAAADDPAQGTVWDLSPLFSDDAAWDKERVQVEAALLTLSRLKGTLGTNAGPTD